MSIAEQVQFKLYAIIQRHKYCTEVECLLNVTFIALESSCMK